MKYNYFQEEKLKYEEIEIPDELLFMVRRTIAADRRKKAAAYRIRVMKMAGSVAAILFLCLTIGVNSSYAFAETVVKIPVVKGVAKAVIVRSYKADIIALDEQNSKQPEEMPETTPAPEETVPAVSGNEIIPEKEEPVQTPQEPEPEKEPDGFDAWKAEMTPEKFREITELYTPDMEERYADAPEKLRTILLAEVPEQEVFLYGYHENGKLTGTALLVKDTYRYFDWNYMNGTKKLPEISFADTDRDGTEEVIVFLYNGASQMKEISKEDMEPPKEPDNAETTENTASDKNKETAEGMTSAPEGMEGNNSQDTISGDDKEETAAENNKASVSGNDIKQSSGSEETPEQQAGEIWIVSPEKEDQPAAVLSVDDYESQILHQLKAEYKEASNTVQLYFMEEPFGEPVEISFENQEEQPVYEMIDLVPERKFTTEKGLFLHFDLRVTFLNKEEEKILLPLNLNLKAEISLEEGSLIVRNIEKQ